MQILNNFIFMYFAVKPVNLQQNFDLCYSQLKLIDYIRIESFLSPSTMLRAIIRTSNK